MSSTPTFLYLACKGLIVRNNQLLLLRKDKQPAFWDLPGGRMSHHERFHQGLKRELREELPDISQIQVGKLVGVYKRLIHQGKDELALLYFKVTAKLPDPIQTSAEHTAAKWFSLDELEKTQKDVNPNYFPMMKKILANVDYGVDAYEPRY